MPSPAEARPVWSRPPFIAAAVLLVLVLTLAVVLAVRGPNGQTTATPAPTTTPSESTPSTPTQPSQTNSSSICGLKGDEDSGTLAEAPDVEWAYQGTTAYPTSRSAGPGETDAAGIRTCFQHTPDGALLAAANALVQPLDHAVVATWTEDFVAQGEYREQILAEATTPIEDSASTRLNIAGFRLLAYSAASARVDIAVRASVDGVPVVSSSVYELVWQDGDWKLSAETPTPVSFAAIPDLAGYVPWGA